MSQTAPMISHSTYPLPDQHLPEDHERVYFTTHHLPTHPAPKLAPSLEFQHLYNRLNNWNSLHSYRTGDEYLFQNYYRESNCGPEILWALPPILDHRNEILIKSQIIQKPIENSKRKRVVGEEIEEEEEEEADSSTPSLASSSLYGGPVSSTSEVLQFISPPSLFGFNSFEETQIDPHPHHELKKRKLQCCC
ncbi:hypothetical protein DFH28DRAFT_931502 [Melampsora americana]|nr:hypothetical protein DFH28DRAFT_931502 [Melampsora americana]